MRILVTGGTGLIGRYAVRALADEGHEVFVLTRNQQAANETAAGRFIPFDMLAKGADFSGLFAQYRVDILLHLAWETEHGKFWTAPTNTDWLAASLQLAKSFLKAGGQRIVCAGTCVEYEPCASGPCIAGQTPINPRHPYSISKNTLHQKLKNIVASHNASLAWGRIFMVMGPGEHPDRLVPSVINAVLRGEMANCSSGRQVRDFMHTKDIGAAFALLAASEYDGELNICSGEPVSIAHIVNRLSDMLGHPELVGLGTLPDRADDPPNLWGENETLVGHLGFSPDFTLDAGLEDVIGWWREHRIIDN